MFCFSRIDNIADWASTQNKFKKTPYEFLNICPRNIMIISKQLFRVRLLCILYSTYTISHILKLQQDGCWFHLFFYNISSSLHFSRRFYIIFVCFVLGFIISFTSGIYYECIMFIITRFKIFLNTHSVLTVLQAHKHIHIHCKSNGL